MLSKVNWPSCVYSYKVLRYSICMSPKFMNKCGLLRSPFSILSKLRLLSLCQLDFFNPYPSAIVSSLLHSVTVILCKFLPKIFHMSYILSTLECIQCSAVYCVLWWLIYQPSCVNINDLCHSAKEISCMPLDYPVCITNFERLAKNLVFIAV